MQVVAYLDFLKKHALALPARQSMACSLASFLVHRKMLTASLLSGPPALPSAFTSEFLEPKSHSGTVDLILESLCEALEIGTSSDSCIDKTASESGMVILASPQYLGNEQVVRRVSLHKIVVDASLKVLSLLAFKCDKGYEEKPGFSRLLNILFPDAQFPLAWLEEKNGEKMHLLTEEQSIMFSRSNVGKLIRAGETVLQMPVGFTIIAEFYAIVSSNSYGQCSECSFNYFAICCSVAVILIMYFLVIAFHINFGFGMRCFVAIFIVFVCSERANSILGIMLRFGSVIS